MLTTACDKCCFFSSDKGCSLHNLCISDDNGVLTPGYCRQCRSHKWIQKQTITSLSELRRKIEEENSLANSKMDVLIHFDESKHTIESLQETMENLLDAYSDYIGKIIIMDVTGFGDRSNTCLAYLNKYNSQNNRIPLMIDSSAQHETVEQTQETIRRVSRQVKYKFFLVIPCGRMIIHPHSLIDLVNDVRSRVIHWNFPRRIKSTRIIPYVIDYGLYITVPYRSLIAKSDGKLTFTQQLKLEEEETGIRLSMLCSECCLI